MRYHINIHNLKGTKKLQSFSQLTSFFKKIISKIKESNNMELHFMVLQRLPEQISMVWAQTLLFQCPKITWVPGESFRSALFSLKAIIRQFDFKNAKSQVLLLLQYLCFLIIYIHTETQTSHLPCTDDCSNT